MGSKELSIRNNWQKQARNTGDEGEESFVMEIAKHLPEHYNIIHKPKKLVIYPNGRGIKLDSVITNTITGKSLYFENKKGNNAGNAHERVYKYLSEPLKRLVREKYNTVEEPFFLIFSGDTFQKEKYKNEITLLLEGSNYAIIEPSFKNIQQIAKQIMEIV
jgi:hypothetical protein